MTARPRHADRARRRRGAHPPRAVLRLRQNRSTPTRLPGRHGHLHALRARRRRSTSRRRLDPRGGAPDRPDAPYACMGGACGTCRAKLLDGTVEMDHNFALGQRRPGRRLRPHLPVAPHQPRRDRRLRRIRKPRWLREQQGPHRKSRTAGCSRWPRAAPPMHRRSADPTRHSCATCKTRSSTFCETSRDRRVAEI